MRVAENLLLKFCHYHIRQIDSLNMKMLSGNWKRNMPVIDLKPKLFLLGWMGMVRVYIHTYVYPTFRQE